MPIKRELRDFHPIDWRPLSRSIRFRRAKGSCECCGRPHGQIVCVLADGRWFDAEMIHDRPHHLARRRVTYRPRRAIGDLFTGLTGSGGDRAALGNVTRPMEGGKLQKQSDRPP